MIHPWCQAALLRHSGSTASLKEHTHTISIIFGTCAIASIHWDETHVLSRWKPFDPVRNFPDLGPRFIQGENKARQALAAATSTKLPEPEQETVADDKRDLDWATVLKRTFEAYIRGERPNMYGEWIQW